MMIFACAGAFVCHNRILIEVNADAARMWKVCYWRYMTIEIMVFAFAGAFICHNGIFIEVNANAETWNVGYGKYVVW